MDYEIYAPMIKGVLVAVFLATLKFKVNEPRWWIAMLSLGGLAVL